MKLVYKEDAVKMLRGKCVAKYPNTFMMGLFAAADEIEKLPEVEAVSLVHGQWVVMPGYYPVCSCCGASAKDTGKTPYCCMCGAKMEAKV